MNELINASILTAIVFVAGMISIELGISAAIIEIILGVFAGNVLHISPTSWLMFLASIGGVLLTFLAGTEVNTKLMKEKFKQSLLIGGLSFLLPFLLVFGYTYFIAHWTLNAAKIAGVALSTTSLAVVYAVLVESGLNKTELGKVIMASTFVTDLGTALALSLLFIQFNVYTLIFLGFSILLFILGPKVTSYLFQRYSNQVIEPEIKLVFLILLVAMLLGEVGKMHAVLPIFIFGLLMSDFFQANKNTLRKLRTVSFAFITPFFFIKGGLNVSLQEISANWLIVAVLLVIKIIGKVIGVYPVARITLPRGGRIFTTLLMSTGLTFGTIASVFGYQAGYINKSQFSIIVAVIILSAVVPTIIAQRFFSPISAEDKEELLAEGEEG